MVEVTLKGKPVQVPSMLEELNADQYKHYLFLVVALRRGIIDVQEFRVQLLSYLLGMRAPLTSYREELSSPLMEQMGVLDGFFDGDEPRLSTGMNLLPSYEGWESRVGDMLNGLSFGDFIECLDALGVINESDDDDTRQGAFELITGKLYNKPADATDAPLLLAVHAVTLLVSVFNMLTHERIQIAGKDIDFGIIFRPVPGMPTRANDNTGWHGMAMEVASSGVFGPMKEVNATPMWDVLLYLYKCKFELLHDKTLRRVKK